MRRSEYREAGLRDFLQRFVYMYRILTAHSFIVITIQKRGEIGNLQVVTEVGAAPKVIRTFLDTFAEISETLTNHLTQLKEEEYGPDIH